MNIFPAIDLYNGCAVRLVQGDYNKMTVYNDNPVSQALDFKKCGAKFLHLVDLQGARDGTTTNIKTIEKIVNETDMFVQVGGGIRSEEVISQYLDIGVDRVILGTVAITNQDFTEKMVKKYGEKIAVGVDVKDGKVAIKGWTEISQTDFLDFIRLLQGMGVKTVICTDISKDGALNGTNIDLYRQLQSDFSIDIIASGGISTIDDIKTLDGFDLYGAILGKALYTGKINLKDALLLKG